MRVITGAQAESLLELSHNLKEIGGEKFLKELSAAAKNFEEKREAAAKAEAEAVGRNRVADARENDIERRSRIVAQAESDATAKQQATDSALRNAQEAQVSAESMAARGSEELAAKLRDLDARESTLVIREQAVLELTTAARGMKSDYEGKLAQLKKISG